jgi:hypothetical protein
MSSPTKTTWGQNEELFEEQAGVNTRYDKSETSCRAAWNISAITIALRYSCPQTLNFKAKIFRFEKLFDALTPALPSEPGLFDAAKGGDFR